MSDETDEGARIARISTATGLLQVAARDLILALEDHAHALAREHGIPDRTASPDHLAIALRYVATAYLQAYPGAGEDHVREAFAIAMQHAAQDARRAAEGN
jgi:hypothetical protein